MTPIESAIHDFVREHAEAETRFLAEIVKVPSDNPPGDCDRSAEVVATLLEGLGFQVERHKVPESLVKANGMVSATNLIARRRFGQGGPTIALNAHGDVVPPGSGWTHDPYGAQIVDGWMVGRGAAVSKSDIATYAFAMLALEKCGAVLNGAVELHVTYDEEAGGEIGPRYLLEQRPLASRFSDRRRLLLCGRQRPQWLPSFGGRDCRPLGSRRPPFDRRRRVGSGERNSFGSLWLARWA